MEGELIILLQPTFVIKIWTLFLAIKMTEGDIIVYLGPNIAMFFLYKVLLVLQWLSNVFVLRSVNDIDKNHVIILVLK